MTYKQLANGTNSMGWMNEIKKKRSEIQWLTQSFPFEFCIAAHAIAVNAHKAATSNDMINGF